jgi:hypothetical protein
LQATVGAVHEPGSNMWESRELRECGGERIVETVDVPPHPCTQLGRSCRWYKRIPVTQACGVHPPVSPIPKLLARDGSPRSPLVSAQIKGHRIRESDPLEPDLPLKEVYDGGCCLDELDRAMRSELCGRGI